MRPAAQMQFLNCLPGITNFGGGVQQHGHLVRTDARCPICRGSISGKTADVPGRRPGVVHRLLNRGHRALRFSFRGCDGLSECGQQAALDKERARIEPRPARRPGWQSNTRFPCCLTRATRSNAPAKAGKAFSKGSTLVSRGEGRWTNHLGH